jgi:S1-C subfamily serine protease
MGCGVQAAAPPREQPTVTVPSLDQVAADVPQAVRVTVPILASESQGRRARQLTVRVRNIGCDGVAVGSGFPIAKDVLVTNRHVLAGASNLEVSTWDGHSLRVSSAAVGVLGDLGIAVVDGQFPTIGHFGQPGPGDAITVVGYPEAQALTLSQGIVVDLIDGMDLGIPGNVMRLTARVEHGNSGGPVLGQNGKIVGVVYAFERSTGFGLAIPTDTLVELARTGGFQDVPPCGSE